MNFDVEKSIEVLERTPRILKEYLNNLSEDWLRNNEGGESWSSYEILGHLIFGEKTDWLVRIEIILNDSQEKLFEPFDRFAQRNDDQTKPISILLEEFQQLRIENLKKLKSFNISENDYLRQGVHPEFGQVTLQELIATWVVHDLGHIAQISRVMAKQYKEEVGPWVNYLGILTKV